jgi:hypothetical protein
MKQWLKGIAAIGTIAMSFSFYFHNGYLKN